MSSEDLNSLVDLTAHDVAGLLLAYQTGDAAKVVGDMSSLGSMHPQRLLSYVNLIVDVKELLTPLHIVSDNHSDAHLAIAALLIENKADINRPDRSGATPLHIAAARNNFEMVNILCRREDVRLNVPNPQGYTPLHLAIFCNGVDSASLLIKAGACVTIQSNPADSLSTPAFLIIEKHKSAPLEWDFPKKRVDCEVKFLESVRGECALGPVVPAIFGVMSPERVSPVESKRAPLGATLSRLTHLVGSLLLRGQQLLCDRSVTTNLDLWDDTIGILGACVRVCSRVFVYNSSTPPSPPVLQNTWVRNLDPRHPRRCSVASS